MRQRAWHHLPQETPRRELQSLEAALKKAGKGFTYNSPANGATEPGKASFIALNGLREYQSQATTAWELDTSGRLRAALARARADQQIAAADLAIIERDLKRAVTGAFYRVLLARRLPASIRSAMRAVVAAFDVRHASLVALEATRLPLGACHLKLSSALGLPRLCPT